jgi:hypothetical protein
MKAMRTSGTRKGVGAGIVVLGWLAGVVGIAYGILMIGAVVLSNSLENLWGEQRPDPYKPVLALAVVVAGVMGVSILRNVHRLGRHVMGRGTDLPAPRVLAARLLAGAVVPWAAFGLLCLLVWPSPSEVDDPVVPWIVPRDLPYHVVLLTALVVVAIVGAVWLRWNRSDGRRGGDGVA